MFLFCDRFLFYSLPTFFSSLDRRSFHNHTFLAHLVDQFLAHMKRSPKANASISDRFCNFRAVLNEEEVDQRVQYTIEVLMQVRKDQYKDNPILPEGLDLVEEDEQITHQIQLLDEELDAQDSLSKFEISFFSLCREDLTL